MKADNDQPKVTLEQLLRVKRAERPSPEFWAQFDRELREKQLAAIVEPRPWWAPFIRVGNCLIRYQVPIGAAAVVALAFLSVRQYEGATSRIVPAVPQVAEGVDMRELSLASGDAPNTVLLELDSNEVSEAALLTENISQLGSRLGAAAMLVSGGGRTLDRDVTHSAAAHHASANLVGLKGSERELVSLPSALERAFISQSAPTLTAQATVRDPLSQAADGVVQRRSNRLLASALPATATVVIAASARGDSTLRSNRSISEERLYDSMRRGGMSAERIPIKF